jgi:replicative DNA helicase
MSVSVRQANGSVPPQNLEAEASVLGSILLTEQALDGVLLEVGLRPEHFYRPRNALIFRAMMRLKEKAEPEAVDALTVCEDLDRTGELEEAGGTDYVHSLPAEVIAAGNVHHYARIVKQHAMRRRLLATAREIQDQVFTHAGDAQQLVEEAEAALFRVGHEEGSGEMRSLESVLDEEVDRLERLSREGIGVTGTPSGFRQLDEITGGFQPGNLIVVAARPAMGKSALVTNIAENAALDHGKGVALFSLEMAEAELAQRFLASQAKLNGRDLRRGQVKADRWPKVMQASDRLSKAPIFVDDSSDIGILEIRAKARRLHSKNPLGLLIVDYLQLLRADPSADSRVEQVGQMSRGLKILARELEIPVIAVSQLSRAVESRNPPKPMLSDLRECVTADTPVTLADGRRVEIEQLVGSTPDVLTLDSNDRVVTAHADKVWRVGRRPILRMRLSSGRVLRGTAQHRVRTGTGWTRLGELRGGERVCVARALPEPSEPIASGSLASPQAATSSILLERPRFARVAKEDLFWDRVVSVEPDGEEEVFDLTVPGPACWLSDGIVSHNSGQIEQDADLVVFLYREEYYDAESDRPGEADVIVSKHRNGPIGEVPLAFISQHPKFVNLARDPAGAPPGSDGFG